ncbi:MAG: xanthine dehydrogenase family protein subunit M [Deltaproteobacteria bacterium]|nr:xanthine dehydrogenase family protein subunit M [Deltaproteobacteria bacterium]
MLPEFELVQPENLNEATDILLDLGEKACLLAGGTDVFTAMREKGFEPEVLVDLKTIKELRGIGPAGDHRVSIGATTNLREVETSNLVREVCPVLAETVGKIGSIQVRNRGTIGGNLGNGSPAADSAVALLILDAEVELESSAGRRTVPIESFFIGPGETAIKRGEILRRVFVNAIKPATSAVFLKYGPRQAMDCAIVSVAVALTFDPSGGCQRARVALGAVAPTPIRARQTEALLMGGEITQERLEKALEAARAEARPISDIRASAGYRSHLVEVLVKRAVKKAVDQHGAAMNRSR